MTLDRLEKWLMVAAAVFAVVAVAGLVGRIAVDRPTPRFTVEFRSLGGSCERDEDTLYLDATTGESLECSAALTPAHAQQVTEQPSLHVDISRKARALAQDGSLTEDDLREVRRFADSRATEAGYDQSGLSRAESALRIAMGGGFGLATLCLVAVLIVGFVDTRRPFRFDPEEE